MANNSHTGNSVIPVPSTLVKRYPRRGPLQQFRFSAATSFQCCRCGKPKKSKLLVNYSGDWSRCLCNACYGLLLSIYKVKSGTDEDDVKVQKLTGQLLEIVSSDDERRAAQLLRASEARTTRLSPQALRFLATAQHLSKTLRAGPELEWSPAVIGLCKAVEVEIVRTILDPLAKRSAGSDLSGDTVDRDIRRVAVYCDGSSAYPPEIGAFAHFLQTAIHSRKRRQESVLLHLFLEVTADWVGAEWIMNPDGLYRSLTVLTREFRNRAAHIDELGAHDYMKCSDLVIGPKGLLWKLSLGVERRP